jgi:hypothetical protein
VWIPEEVVIEEIEMPAWQAVDFRQGAVHREGVE